MPLCTEEWGSEVSLHHQGCLVSCVVPKRLVPARQPWAQRLRRAGVPAAGPPLGGKPCNAGIGPAFASRLLVTLLHMDLSVQKEKQRKGQAARHRVNAEKGIFIFLQ